MVSVFTSRTIRVTICSQKGVEQMEIMLADNIRRLRRERSLTQEQLAEVLGVTVGAVYKWEARLSYPELSLIVEMADFFDTSVDVLLGYEMKDNRLESCVRRLKDYRHEKNPAGLAEAEKALKKYPHIFEIVHESATMYRLFGIENRNRDYLRRALELQEEVRTLLPQNTDPEIGEISVYGELAEIYLALDEYEKALDILKKHNASGLYNDLIGLALSQRAEKVEEAVPYLSQALLGNVSSLIQTIGGFANVYSERRDYSSGEAILDWGTELLAGLKKDWRLSFLDKVNSVFTASLAYFRLKNGKTEEARRTLQKARSVAKEFDTRPDYSAASVRFVEMPDRASASDDIGTTAAEGLENFVRETDDEEFTELWRKI